MENAKAELERIANFLDTLGNTDWILGLQWSPGLGDKASMHVREELIRSLPGPIREYHSRKYDRLVFMLGGIKIFALVEPLDEDLTEEA